MPFVYMFKCVHKDAFQARLSTRNVLSFWDQLSVIESEATVCAHLRKFVLCLFYASQS